MSVLGGGALAGDAARAAAGRLSATATSMAPRRRVGEIIGASSGGLVGARMGQRAGRSPMPKTTAAMRAEHGGEREIPSLIERGRGPRRRRGRVRGFTAGRQALLPSTRPEPRLSLGRAG